MSRHWDEDQIVRYFFDTEFLHDETMGLSMELISAGIINEAGDKEYYGVSSEFNEAACAKNPWMRENVLAKLPPQSARVSLDELRQGILDSLEESDEAHFWFFDSGGHDMFALTSLFGGLLEFRKTLYNEKGIERIRFQNYQGYGDMFDVPLQDLTDDQELHSAIDDARRLRDSYRALREKVYAVSPALKL